MDRASLEEFHRKLAVAEKEGTPIPYTMEDLSSPELRAMSLEEALVYVFGADYSHTDRYKDLMRIDLRHLKWSVPGHTKPHRMPTKNEVILIHIKKAEGWVMFGGGPMRL